MKKKSLLLSSLALLVVAMVAFTGATYAWFVAGAAPSVANIQAKVADVGVVKMAAMKAGDTAWVATSATDNYYTEFTTVVTEAKIKGSADRVNPNWNTTPLPLYPTSLNSALTTPVQNITAGVFSFINEAGTADTVNYIKYDLYFSNESTDTTYIVSLDTDKTDFFVDDDPTNYGLAATNTANPGQAQIAKSLRLGLSSAKMTGTVDGQTSLATVAGGAGTIVYAPDSAGIITSDTTFWTAERLKPGAQTAPAGTTLTKASANASTGMIDLFEIDSVMTAGVVDISTGNIVKLTVYIWIEGNDPDCLSGVAGYFFTNGIQFGVREKA